LEHKAPGRYYTPWQILIGTILGGPMAGGFLIAGDHSAFGAAGKGRLALGVSCLVIVAIVLLRGAGADTLDPVEGSIIAGFVAGLYGVYARVALTAQIASRRTAGWTPHTWPRVLGISFAFMVAILLLLSLAASNPGGPS
jgi:hypothetical protein